MIYTGIGSRETPPDVLEEMFNIAYRLAGMDWTLRSGGAPGADQAFEKGAFIGAGVRQIFLPWKTFEKEARAGFRVGSAFLDEAPEAHPEAFTIATKYHPRWQSLKYGAKMLHARNTHQILGWDLKSPSDFVICWTKDGKRGGGTGQALRIAEAYMITIYDLALDEDAEALEAFLLR